MPPGVTDISKRAKILDRFSRMHATAIGTGMVGDYVGHIGLDCLAEADILKVASLHGWVFAILSAVHQIAGGEGNAASSLIRAGTIFVEAAAECG